MGEVFADAEIDDGVLYLARESWGNFELGLGMSIFAMASAKGNEILLGRLHCQCFFDEFCCFRFPALLRGF